MPFQTLNGVFDAPPFHVHCRSIIVPWIPGFVNEARAAANAELQRRPLAQRDTRKFTGMPTVETAEVKATRLVPDEAPIPEPAPGRVITQEEAARIVPRVSDEASNALETYVSGADVEWNIALRADDAGDPDLLALADGIFASKGLPEAIQVYRGVDAAGWLPENMAGHILVEHGFLSTTVDRAVARGFARGGSQPVVFEITAPKGAKGVVVDEWESEILFGPGTRILIERDSVVKGVRVIVGRLL